MPVNLTSAAADHARRFLASREHGLGIRVGVRTTGCSGMAYTLEFVDTVDDSDEAFESFGVNLFVSKKDLPYLDGMSLDYQKQGLNEGFAFINPNESARCGCGESFTV